MSVCYLLGVDFSKILVEEFPDILVHRGQSLVSDLGSLWRVSVIKSILHQANLTGIQMLHLFFTNHDLLEPKEKKEKCN